MNPEIKSEAVPELSLEDVRKKLDEVHAQIKELRVTKVDSMQLRDLEAQSEILNSQLVALKINQSSKE